MYPQNYFSSPEFLEKEQNFLAKYKLKKITAEDGFIIDEVPYATKDNFCGEELYSHPFIYLRQEAFDEMTKVQKRAQEQGYKIKIFDAYRPFEVQSHMAEKFPEFVEGGYVSHPSQGIATHVRGIAIDLTLCDKNGKELEMGTGFDEMNEKSYHASAEISEEARKNRQILSEKIINTKGEKGKGCFEEYPNEWWHYNLEIFQYNQNGEIEGAIPEADAKYPKIPAGAFLELLHQNIRQKIEQKTLGQESRKDGDQQSPRFNLQSPYSRQFSSTGEKNLANAK